MNDGLLTLASIHTVAGGSLAVLLVVHLVKNMPFVKALSVPLLSAVVGEIIVITTSPIPITVSGWTILLLNGILLSSTAIGGWHLVKGSVNKKG